MESLIVSAADRSYPVLIGQGLHNVICSLLAENGIGHERKIILVTDSNVFPLYGQALLARLRSGGFTVQEVVIPAGEASKQLEQYQYIVDRCLQFGLLRSDLIIALGGGVVGDLAGFVAATYMRGIAYIHMPTTLLAHDSCIGGKVGLNFRGKNLLGSFHHPQLVIYDISTLATLPKKEVISGYAEVIKHAVIADPLFFSWLEEHVSALLALEASSVAHAISTACQLKARIVAEDEHDLLGVRAYLNFGHTVGHAIEACSSYGYSHGSAVSIGINCALQLSQHFLGLPGSVASRIRKLLQSFDLPIMLPSEISAACCLAAMRNDKKKSGSSYTFVLMHDLASMQLVTGIEEHALVAVMFSE